jgi:hypothetical protein
VGGTGGRGFTFVKELPLYMVAEIEIDPKPAHGAKSAVLVQGKLELSAG